MHRNTIYGYACLSISTDNYALTGHSFIEFQCGTDRRTAEKLIFLNNE